jgi:hypothetical protein
VPSGIIKTNHGNVILSRRSAKDDLGHGFHGRKLATLTAVPAILGRGAYLGEFPDFSGKPLMNRYWGAKVKVDNNEEFVIVRARQAEGCDQRFYLHEIYTEDEIKKEIPLNVEEMTLLDQGIRSDLQAFPTEVEGNQDHRSSAARYTSKGIFF